MKLSIRDGDSCVILVSRNDVVYQPGRPTRSPERQSGKATDREARRDTHIEADGSVLTISMVKTRFINESSTNLCHMCLELTNIPHSGSDSDMYTSLIRMFHNPNTF